jgi:hypothetical protein
MPACRELVHSNVIPGPFDRLPSGRYRFRPLFWPAAMFVRQNVKTLGAGEMWKILNRDHSGKKLLEQMREFLPIEDFQELSQFGS